MFPCNSNSSKLFDPTFWIENYLIFDQFIVKSDEYLLQTDSQSNYTNWDKYLSALFAYKNDTD